MMPGSVKDQSPVGMEEIKGETEGGVEEEGREVKGGKEGGKEGRK